MGIQIIPWNIQHIQEVVTIAGTGSRLLSAGASLSKIYEFVKKEHLSKSSVVVLVEC